MRELAKLARAAHPHELVTYKWIPRDENSHADRLANKALDGDVSTNVPMQKNFLIERLVSGEKPTVIYFVRHGETILTPERRFSGGDGSDPELSAEGLAQAEAVGRELAARKADLIIASPMVRTKQTADAIAKATGLKVTYDEAWREAGFGEWDGLTIPQVKDLYPNEWLSWVSSTGAIAGTTGESYEDVAARSDLALTNLALEHPGKTIIVVTHNYVIRTLVAAALGAPLESVYHLDVLPCSITTINTWASDGLRALRGMSERSHLK
jgi:probable phosphoglycerate mutase